MNNWALFFYAIGSYGSHHFSTWALSPRIHGSDRAAPEAEVIFWQVHWMNWYCTRCASETQRRFTVALPWPQVPEVTSKSGALRHGWSIIWETAGPAERAGPRPWESWEKKLCLARSYTGGRCHTSYEDFGMGFPGSRKVVIPKWQAERLGLSVTHSAKFNGNGFTESWTRPLFQGVNNEWEDTGSRLCTGNQAAPKQRLFLQYFLNTHRLH